MTKKEQFERLCVRLLESNSSELSEVNFAELCHLEGLSEKDADEFCYAGFGLSGEDILAKIQSDSIVIAI